MHGLSIDSSTPLLKQHTPGVQNVLPSRKHMPADVFSTRWQQRQQHFAADRSKRQPVAAWVHRHCGSASRTHAAAWSPKSCNQRGSGPDCWGGHTSGKMKSAVSRCRSLTVSRTRCAGALSCWKTKLSPATLSLIHIWRCRRIERCRSRWSPYH